MDDLCTKIFPLKRPSLLLRAARFGLNSYSRERDLRRLVSGPVTTERALAQLIAEEERLESIRTMGKGHYPVARHIDVLIALLAEARLLPRSLAL
jgi:hypothetical protein